MEEERISRTIAAKNYKIRLWVFLASFLFSTGLFLVFKSKMDSAPTDYLFIKAISFGFVFGVIFQFAMRNAHGVNLKPWKLKKTRKKLPRLKPEEQIKLEIAGAKAGFFPKAGVLAISNQRFFFIPHHGKKTLSFSHESINSLSFSTSDFNSSGKQRIATLNLLKGRTHFIIYQSKEAKLQSVMNSF